MARPIPATEEVLASLPGAVSVVFPVTHGRNYGGYCTTRRFARDSNSLSTLADVPVGDEVELIGEILGGRTNHWTVRVPTSFLLGSRRADAPSDGLIDCEEKIQDGPDANKTFYVNCEEAVSLARRVALDYYGWRLAGSDELYPGTVAYPLDAHDDALLFDYSSSGASLRVCPCPRNHNCEQELLHASEFNCEREVVYHYQQSSGGWAYVRRPLYADGSLGPPCFVEENVDMSSCEDFCQSGT